VPRILVADDNTNIQKMVALAFEERGIDVVSVGNGEAAVRRIPDLNPDLVLADVFMPVRNGYEVCEFVKKDDRFSHVPVILLVGAFDPLDEKEARRVGADGVLKKPFVPPDPLIAMVTSALEKNPKVAAEMAKAREAAAAPPPEPIAPVLEAPARMEPKPLPEFPEPSPEEAAQIYGFGKGVRNIGDEEEEAAGGEPKAPKAPKATSKKGGKQEDEEEEEDGEALTAHDWRRTANDFEVPEEVGGKLAFASDEDFNPISFPSEREVPPRRVPVTDQESSALPVSQNKIAQVEPEAEPQPVEEIVAKVTLPQMVAALPAPSTPVVEETPLPPPVVPEPSAARQEIPPPPASKKSGWMDMMSSPSEYSDGGWLSSIFNRRGEKKSEKEQASEPSAEPIAVAASDNTAHEEMFQAPVELQAAPVSSEQAEQEDQAVEQTPAAAAESWFAPPPPAVLQSAPESHFPLSTTAASDLGNELMAAPADVSGAIKDPELEEPPAAHVTREPLLVNDDEASGPSRFSGASEQPQPLHSFFAPASGDPSVQEPPAEELAPAEEFSSSIFAPSAAPEVPAASDERIPTAPPPNREALADIPFLMPPPPSPLESEPISRRASTPESVDAVVAKVLEKLEPQLHQLLSQGVLRPLVVNLLHQVLEKKEK